MFEFGIISDEVSHDLHEAIAFAQQNGLKYLELRSVNQKNLIEAETKQIRAYSKILHEEGLRCFCYPSPTFKWLQDGKDQSHLIYKAFEIANILNCSYIRIFSYLKSDLFISDRFYEDLVFWNDFAEKEEKYLLLENEPSCNIQTFQDLYSFLNPSRFSRIFPLPDLGNQTEISKKSDLENLTRLAPLAPNIHVKDYSRAHSSYVVVGEGDSEIAASVSPWIEKKTRAVFTLETHVRGDKKHASQLSLDNLKAILHPFRSTTSLREEILVEGVK